MATFPPEGAAASRPFSTSAGTMGSVRARILGDTGAWALLVLGSVIMLVPSCGWCLCRSSLWTRSTLFHQPYFPVNGFFPITWKSGIRYR